MEVRVGTADNIKKVSKDTFNFLPQDIKSQNPGVHPPILGPWEVHQEM